MKNKQEIFDYGIDVVMLIGVIVFLLDGIPPERLKYFWFSCGAYGFIKIMNRIQDKRL